MPQMLSTSTVMQTVLIRVIFICKALFFIGKAVTLNLLEAPVYGHIKAKKGRKAKSKAGFKLSPSSCRPALSN